MILLELILVALGVSIILTSFFLRFRDIQWIWNVVLQAGFWGTPIVYPIDVVPEKYQILFKVNPMARIIMNFRAVVIFGEKIPLNDISFTWAVICGLLTLGLFAFNKIKHNLPEWV
jgi:lipopolysaccharide transport system permease protein